MLIVLTGILTAVACETLCCLMMKRRPTILDGSAAVIGGLIGALMPPAAPYWLPIIASAFAILVAKMPFGGSGRYLFNPAAAGIAVVTLCFTYTMFRYPDPGLVNQSLPLGDLSGVVTESSPAAQLSSGRANAVFLEHVAVRRFSRPHRGHRHCGAGRLRSVSIFQAGNFTADHTVVFGGVRANRCGFSPGIRRVV